MLDMRQGRILVTGGSGMIGSAIIWALNRRGFANILVSDRLDTSEKWKNLVPLRFEDYLDADDLLMRISHMPETLADVQTVFHLGACSATTETDSAFLMKNNYQYTVSLAEWCLANGKRFVYASSAATYGALEEGLSEDLEPTTLRPLNMYAYSKHLFDLRASREGWLSYITGVKYFNIFGPNENHKANMRSVVNKAYTQIMSEGRVTLFKSYRSDFADGMQRRDFFYVKDAAAATIHLAESESVGLFNVGSGEARTWVDLVRPIFSALGRPERIEFIDMPSELVDKYQYHTKADISKIKESGYKGPITPLHEAVHEYVARYLMPGKLLDVADDSDCIAAF